MKKKGFTLVELLAVIAILAILVIIAMPNVLNMFNKAKQDSFETEVKTIIKTVEKQWISDSMGKPGVNETIYCRVDGVDCENSLKMDGNKDIDYYVKVDSQGNIVQLGATNDEYQFTTNKKGIKAEDEINSSVVSELENDEVLKVTTNGIVVKDKIIDSTLNEYGFYYGKRYVGGNIRDGFVDSKRYFIFKKDGTVRMWEELGEQDYYAHKSSIDGDQSVNNYEDAKATWNYIWGDKENGMLTNNTTYNKYHVFVDYINKNFKYQLNIYFSYDGKTLYLDKDLSNPIAKLEE